MNCKKVRAENFRNIALAEVEFCPGVNILLGENAQGKTNLLESIFLSSVGRSFRSNHTEEMIRFGESSADVTLDYEDSVRQNQLHIKIFKEKHRIVEKNGLKMDKLSDMVGCFRAVLFCPEHLSLIKDGPSERRSYLDMAISRLYPMYIHSLQRYSHFLKQRNALIKNAYFDRIAFDSTVDIYSERLAEEAAVISAFRYDYLVRAEKHIAVCFSEMMGGSEIPTLFYDSSSGLEGDDNRDKGKVKDRYIELLNGSHDREISAGSTLFGIHKEDIDIKINGKSARIYGSQGQQRSLALALKLAEGEICFEEFGDQPVFLFDDVLSELDGGRRDYLINKMTGKQVIMTTCEEDSAKLINNGKIIRVSGGQYV